MQIGWIDFSDTDRKKAVDVIHLLSEGAVDELGIGVVRDAFANVFFPAISTIETRAKYFYLIPYALKAACADNLKATTISPVIQRFRYYQHQTAIKLVSNGHKEGVIGVDSLKQWVIRQPSDIYWNAIRTLGILRGRDTQTECMLRELQFQRDRLSNASSIEEMEEGISDDEQAGQEMQGLLWDLPEDYSPSLWMENLSIDLTESEASKLREQFIESPGTKNSLIKVVLENNIADFVKLETVGFSNSFEAMTEFMSDKVSPEMLHLFDSANRFNYLVYALRLRYNIKLAMPDSNSRKEREEKWNSLLPTIQEKIKDLDLCEMFNTLRIARINFLIESRQYILDNNIDALEELLIRRETQLKGSKRCKLLQPEKYQDTWIGGSWLDYRLGPANRIIADIFNGEKGGQNA